MTLVTLYAFTLLRGAKRKSVKRNEHCIEQVC